VPEFDASSTRYCTTCDLTIKIGTGGEHNWDGHITSAGHIRKEKIKPTWSNVLTSFFTKQPKLTRRESPETTSSPTIAVQPALLSSMLNPAPIAGPSTAILDPITNSDQHDLNLQTEQIEEIPDLGLDDVYHNIYEAVNSVPEASSGINFITQLRVATSRLPSTVGLVTPVDELARFSGDPEEELQTHDAPWEMVDRVLNCVVGYGRTTADIAGLIWRGPNGMDGLCNWLLVCIEKFDIDPALLEGKMKCLLDTMALL
jgi:hypothetical protein